MRSSPEVIENENAKARLARLLPDRPRWVETRGMLLSGRCEVLAASAPPPASAPPEPDFLVLGSDFGLLCVAGRPAAEEIARAVAHPVGRQTLCMPEAAGEVGAALPGWSRRRFAVHSLRDGALREPAGSAEGVEVRMLSGRDASRLEHVPPALKDELETALGFAHVAAAIVAGRPVSFCYASYETETLWDVSIDTLEEHRRGGLASRCVAFLADHMARHGKDPVWGADAGNVASMRLAEALGFEPVDELVVFERPAGAIR